MKNSDLLNAAEHLPPAERAALVDSLLRTFEPTDPAIDQQWLKVAQQRLNEITNGTAELVDGEQVFKTIREQLNR